MLYTADSLAKKIGSSSMYGAQIRTQRRSDAKQGWEPIHPLA